MHRRGMFRIGIGLLLAASVVGLTNPPTASANATAAAPAVLPLFTATPCPPAGDVRYDDGVGIGGCHEGITVIPNLDAGPGQASWQDSSNEQKPGAAVTFRHCGETALLGENSDQEPSAYSVDVEGCPGCVTCTSGCAGGGGGVDHGPLFSGGIATLGSVDVRIPLGMANEWRSAGILKLHYEGDPAESEFGVLGLGYVQSLSHDLSTLYSGSRVNPTVYRGCPPEFQIETPDLLADVTQGDVTSTTSSFTICLYPIHKNGTWDTVSGPYCGGHPSDALDVSGHYCYRQCVFTYDSADKSLTITDSAYDDDTSEFMLRATYVYEYNDSNGSWKLTTSDHNDNVLTVETMTAWSESTTGGINYRQRTYTRLDGSNNLVYKHVETQTEFTIDTGYTAWRRTELEVDPDSASPRVTTWQYTTSISGAIGLVVSRVERPDGSWIDYDFAYSAGTTPTWTITTTRGWEDATPSSGTMMQIVRTYARSPNGDPFYLLKAEEASVGSTVVSHTAWDHSEDNDAWTTVEARDQGGSLSALETTYQWHYEDNSYANATRVGQSYFHTILTLDSITYPDGRQDAFDDGYDPLDTNDLVLSNYPAPPSLSGSDDYHWHSVAHLNTSAAPEANKSTKMKTYVDWVGRPVYSETYTYGTDWVTSDPIGWTVQVHDSRGRPSARWGADGALQTTEYNACCDQTVTDTQGIATEISRDPLGRVLHTSRAGVETDYSYSGLTTTATTTPVATSSLSSVTVQATDMHGRPLRMVTNSGTAGALATLWSYGATSAGGDKVTVYRDYDEDPNTVPSAGVRDLTTEYYRDGRVKKTSGATVIETNHDFDALTQIVTTGPSGHTSTETTTYDLLGRVAEVERDGWASSGTATLMTTNTYDSSTGQLEKVESTGQPTTLYVYDTMGRIKQTVVDVNNNATVNLGGSDRVAEMESTIEQISSNWWVIQKSYTYPTPSSSTRLQTSEQRTRLTGYSGSTVSSFTTRESVSIDKLNSDNTTTMTTAIDRNDATRVQTTDVPDSSTDATSTYVDGKLTSTTTAQGVTTTYGYDALNRQTTVTDARGNVTTTAYDTSNRVSTVTDDASDVTTYAYYVTGDSGATTAGSGVWPGRIKSISNPGGKHTYFAYTDRGENWHTWGDVPYPTEYAYDDRGRQSSLKTYRTGDFNDATWPSTPGTASETTWTYHDATGLLNTKTYDDDTAVDYEYTADGKLYKRKWARTSGGNRVTVTYSYFDGSSGDFTGELKKVDYNDSTTDVEYTYDRMGRVATVIDATGTRAFEPNSALAPWKEIFDTGNLFAGLVIKQEYEGSGTGLVPGRWAGVKIGTSSVDDAYYNAAYGYDDYGRLDHVAGPGLPSGGADYTYKLNGSDETGLPETTLFKDGTTTKAWSRWSFEDDRNLVSKVENFFGADDTAPISSYEYKNDARGRRQGVVYSGAAFAGGGFIDDWSYNDRNEILGTDRKSGTDPNTINMTDAFDTTNDATYDRRYVEVSSGQNYDNIGNRYKSRVGTGSGTPVSTYFPNALNQYDTVTQTNPTSGQGFLYDADGNMTGTYVAMDIDGDGDVDATDLSMMSAMYGYTCDDWTGNMDEFLRGDFDGDCDIDVSDWSQLLSLYGTTGDLSLEHAFTWDAENRLMKIEPVSPTSGSKRIEFTYDYRGRRVEKTVTLWNTGASPADWYDHPTETRRFVWNGWLMLRETIDTDANSDGDLLDTGDSTRTKTYTWGKDLGGGLEPAGGIGGLLAVYDDNATTTGGSPTADDLAYVYMYDANGNVGQLCDPSQTSASASIVAKYEYDAYGNVTASGGTYAAANTYRFSTKPWDDETSLGYWGYRYYDPRLGRWLSRDPIGEKGIVNLYSMIMNRAMESIDPLGLDLASCTWACGNPPKNNKCNEGEFWCNCIWGCRVASCGDFVSCLTDVLGSEGLQLGICAAGCTRLCWRYAGASAFTTCMISCTGACGFAGTVTSILQIRTCMDIAHDCLKSADSALKRCVGRY